MTETTNFNLQKPEMLDIVKNGFDSYNNNFDKIDNELVNIEKNTTAINGINNLLYQFGENVTESINITADKYFNETQQADAPFTDENYDYVDVTEDNGSCILSDAFELPNGEYIISSDKRLPTYFMLMIYNPFLGCYEKEVKFHQQLQDDKYIAVVRIDNAFSKNYARFWFGSSVTRWQTYNFSICNTIERYATKEEVSKLLDEITELKNLLNNK